MDPKVIGEGSFGCVHRPPMKCSNKTTRGKNDISKLMASKNASQELNEFKLIKSADKQKDLYLGKPIKCKVDDTHSNRTAISGCSSPAFNSEKIDEYSLLVMKYGGQDLEQFGNEVRMWPNTNDNRTKIELFWLECLRLFYGLKVFHDNGILHHDLKPQNIVYNQETNRLNFIDFGFMTKKSTVVNSAKQSTYWLGSQHHWSFPLENIYWNKIHYMEAADPSRDEADAYVAFEDSVYKSCRHFFVSILPANATSIKKEKLAQRAINAAFATIVEFEPSDYDRFLNASVDTVDSYGLGIALIYVLNRSKHLLSIELAAKLHDMLISDMLNPNVYMRLLPTQLLATYEDILKNSGLLEQHNRNIDNHLVGVGKKSAVKSISGREFLVIPKSGEEMSIEIVRQCPDGKEFKPITKRCVKSCKSGHIRNAAFKCIKNKTRKSFSYKKCADGKQLNPTTGRCVLNCKSGYLRDKMFKCKAAGDPFA
jgi:serine/threonine protein kinase